MAAAAAAQFLTLWEGERTRARCVDVCAPQEPDPEHSLLLLPVIHFVVVCLYALPVYVVIVCFIRTGTCREKEEDKCECELSGVGSCFQVQSAVSVLTQVALCVLEQSIGT